ncbi:MAG TPA: hypothetical protein VFY93_09635 [Planctomycetota bacterium]|nr:hypothetical protein [Planctomycetota bacterium]
MAEIDLKEKFPDLEPGRMPAVLHRVNGIGFAMFGRRDPDRDTGTYVKTWCLSLLFVPVFALRAYRVADAQNGGWYFLGRVPLSPIAKACNLLIVAGVLSLVGRGWWASHTSSPEYRANALVADGAEAAERGQYVAAAAAWRQAIRVSASVAGAVVEGVRGTLDKEMDAQGAAEIYALAAYLQQRPQGPPVAADLGARGLAQARRIAERDPEGALAVADAVAPFLPAEEMTALRHDLLDRIVRSNPSDLDAAVRAVAMHEGDPKRCIALLEPHRERLRSSAPGPSQNDGYRILGRAYVAEDRYEDAFALLDPFVEKRLAQLHEAEKALDKASQQAWDREAKRLNAGIAPEEMKRRWDAAGTEEQRDAIVTEHLNGVVEADPVVRAGREKAMKLAGVVPVALDLGHVRLRRAQGMADPAARKAELEAAEKTFLSIQFFAADSDDYRLFLGQVQCWLGRGQEGHKLFDELLAARDRSAQALLAVAGALREIGAESEARTLAEEAYAKANDAPLRHEIAFLRGITSKDLEDRATWLNRADQGSPRVRATLAATEGKLAYEKGDDKRAAERQADALRALSEMPETVNTCNEISLAWQAQYAVTGDRAALDRAVPPMERALVLEPTSTILRLNAASLLIEVAAREIVGDAIDIEAARLGTGIETLSYVYRDEATRKQVVERYLAHPHVRAATTHLEKAVLMAPENGGALGLLVRIRRMERDPAALRRIAGRLRGARIDVGMAREHLLDYYRGQNADDRAKHDQGMRRLRACLDACRAKGGGTRALLAATLSNGIIEGMELGLEGDPGEAVRLAEEAERAAPSSATRTMCLVARLYRARCDLAEARPADASRLKAEGRVLGAQRQFALLLNEGGALAEAALALDDVRKALDLLAEEQQAFPLHPTGPEWAMLRVGRPAVAERVAAAMAADESTPLLEEIQLRIAPFDAGTAYDAYWRDVAKGDAAGGRAVLERCAAEGVPLPMPSK